MRKRELVYPRDVAQYEKSSINGEVYFVKVITKYKEIVIIMRYLQIYFIFCLFFLIDGAVSLFVLYCIVLVSLIIHILQCCNDSLYMCTTDIRI